MGMPSDDGGRHRLLSDAEVTAPMPRTVDIPAPRRPLDPPTAAIRHVVAPPVVDDDELRRGGRWGFIAGTAVITVCAAYIAFAGIGALHGDDAGPLGNALAGLVATPTPAPSTAAGGPAVAAPAAAADPAAAIPAAAIPAAADPVQEGPAAEDLQLAAPPRVDRPRRTTPRASGGTPGNQAPTGGQATPPGGNTPTGTGTGTAAPTSSSAVTTSVTPTT